MMILDGLEKKHPENVLLKLLAPICGLKNAAMDFWIKLVKVFRKLGCARSPADPFLCCSLASASVVAWLIWIDECLYVGRQDEIVM